MTTVLKVLGAEISISSANTVSNSTLVRVINTSTSATALLNIANTTATYANVTLAPNESVAVVKAISDTVIGPGLRAAPIAYRQ
jgi:hypothetical protein